MRRTQLFLASLVLITAAGCASPERNAQGNSNGSSQPNQQTQPVTAENGTAQANSSPAPSLEPAPKQPDTAPTAVKSDAPAKPATDVASTATPGAKTPKLVVPGSTLNFGKQPQDKKLIRTISIK